MRPEEIRALYEAEEPASDEEAAETVRDMQTDPEMARSALLSLYALANTEPAFGALVSQVVFTGAMELIRREMAIDDTFACKMGQVMSLAMKEAEGKKPKTPRGKPKQARSA